MAFEGLQQRTTGCLEAAPQRPEPTPRRALTPSTFQNSADCLKATFVKQSSHQLPRELLGRPDQHVCRQSQRLPYASQRIGRREFLVVGQQSLEVAHAQLRLEPAVVAQEPAELLLPSGPREVSGQMLMEVAVRLPSSKALGHAGTIAGEESRVQCLGVADLASDIVTLEVVQAHSSPVVELSE